MDLYAKVALLPLDEQQQLGVIVDALLVGTHDETQPLLDLLERFNAGATALDPAVRLARQIIHRHQ